MDVNEQNKEPMKFYDKMGFRLIGRQESDRMKRPFPDSADEARMTIVDPGTS